MANSAGFSAVLPADLAAYTVVRVAGGLVLIVLGFGTLRSARGADDAAPELPDPRRTGWWSAYAAGLGTDLGNPKEGVFAVSVLPQFVTADGPVMVTSVLLGVVWAMVNADW
ncbi:LysE family translocator [Streptomyces hokutonensis]|uniref:LysE family translocator n=1 Tax=Streptomyces hokutonensis TaxID=1306990 RepID=UPI0033C53895